MQRYKKSAPNGVDFSFKYLGLLSKPQFFYYFV